MFTLDTDIIKIGRVGKAMAKKLAAIDIKTVNDLLFYFPYRYDDFGKITAIKNLKIGDKTNIVGQVEIIQNKRSWRRRMYITEALVNDDTGQIKIIWFNQPFLARNLKPGDKISLAGKIEEDYTGLAMHSPAYEKITTGNSIHTQGLVPNYHLTSSITQKQIRFLIKQVIPAADLIPDWLPAEIIRRQKFLTLNAAIKKIHFPKAWHDIEMAKNRLAFDELFLVQLRSQIAKKQLQNSNAYKIIFKEEETKKFVASLPYALTPAQKKSAWEILQDMNKNQPMSRLLEGDVGSGKTVVAAMAMLNIFLNGKQSVLMAPTEILAQQHYETLCKIFAYYSVKIGLVTRTSRTMNWESNIMAEGKTSKKIARNSLFIIRNSDIIIGTHSLIQEKISFKNLALAIIDEQHRFGVDQRLRLTQTNTDLAHSLSPHLLSMTATPIPRTLALALYGDLDLSIINQVPTGRKPIITKVVPEAKRTAAYDFIRKEIKNGRQVFVICPLIDISDKLGVKSVKEEYKKLNEIIFPDLEIGLLHGKLPAGEKEEAIKQFKNNEIKIIVSTSVIEVGIDMPNATIMMIEGADRFGLAQLHQFRGRVGRSEYQSYCFLFSDNSSPKTLPRLLAMEKYNDGFALSKIDLKFRGPGELYGFSQSGFPELKIASLFDYDLIKKSYEEALILLAKDINNYPEILAKIKENIKLIHLN